MNELVTFALAFLVVVLAVFFIAFLLAAGVTLAFFGLHILRILRFLRQFKPELLTILKESIKLLNTVESLTSQLSSNLNTLHTKIDDAGNRIDEIKVPRPSLKPLTSPLGDFLENIPILGDPLVLKKTDLDMDKVFGAVKTSLHDSSDQIDKGRKRIDSVSLACKHTSEKLQAIRSVLETLDI